MWYESNEVRIRRLEEALHDARHAVVTLLPQTIQEIVKTYYSIKSRQQADAWEEELVEAIIEIARPLATETMYSGPRAYCPLCRSGGFGPYVDGFVVPGGLRKHLLGEGNAHPCEVLTPVLELARDYWMPRVAEAEARERAAAEAEKELRRKREDLFLIDPRSAPLLRDELDELRFHAQPRDDESLAWADARLRQLGFSELCTGRIRRFTKEHGDFVVFADPREHGRLNFLVLRKEQVERPKSRGRWIPDHVSFHLLDSWRKDLNEKFAARLESAMQSLTPKSKSSGLSPRD